jgi:phospholipase/carboxylesterase
VWLHGPHNNELELKQIMPLVSMRNYVAAAPRGTAPSEQDNGSHIQFRWLETDDHVELAESRLWECIDGVRQRFNVSADRIFLAGRECGGTMALRLALRNPDCFAGALSFGGPFPEGAAPLIRLRLARRLPLFFTTTAQSKLYPQTLVCQHLRLLHSAGMSVALRQYPGGDDLTTLMLKDMDRWIMEHISTDRPHARSEVIEHRSVN